MINKIAGYFGLSLIIITLLFSAFKYHENRTTKIHELTNTVLDLTYSLDKADLANESLSADINNMDSEITKLYIAQEKLNSKNSELSTKLAKHDLKELAYQKPGLIQNRINAATKKNNELLRDITK